METQKTKGLLGENKIKIIPTKNLRTFDFHELEGKPQTEEQNKKIHDKIVNDPDEPMTKGGESFEHAVHRAFGELKKIIEEKGNKVVVTHNSMYGLIKMWEKEGRPQELDEDFRKKYVNQDTPEINQKSTGDHFVIKSNNGDVIVARHGETPENKNGLFRKPTSMLTPKGKEQAKELGRKLKGKDIKIIYSSDLPRAIETSEIIRKEL